MRNIFKDKVFPITAGYDFHIKNENGKAIDFGCFRGTKIYAPVSGFLKLTPSWYGGPYHCQIIEKNGNIWVFEHCQKVFKQGEVREGDLILESGALGNCFGDHLHFMAGYGWDKQNIDGWGTTSDSGLMDYYLKNCNKPEVSKPTPQKTPKRDTKLVKFTGEIPLYYKGKQIGKTKNNWFGRILKMPDGGYLVEFKNLLCYAKNADINGPKCQLTNGDNKQATKCSISGDLPLLDVNRQEKLKTRAGWEFTCFRSEFWDRYYVVLLNNGEIYLCHSNYINGTRVKEI